jgi:hypothetical protein
MELFRFQMPNNLARSSLGELSISNCIRSGLFQVLVPAIILVGAIFFFLATFSSRPWVFAPWVKVSFWIIGPAGIAWAALKLQMLLHSRSLSRHSYLVLDHYRTLLAGVLLGLLALFFLSGEAVNGYKRWREIKKKTRDEPTGGFGS